MSPATVRQAARGDWVEPPPVCSERLWARATEDLGAEAGVAPDSRGRGCSPERVKQFSAGRRCAAQALADAGSGVVDVGVGAHREPIWPHGYAGSITHSSRFAFAAVARCAQVLSVGVDSEPLFDESCLASIGTLTLHGSEQQLVGGRLDVATAVFSAKESLFKCLYPVAGLFFDYLDAEVASIDLAEGGTCVLALRRGLGPRLPAGSLFTVRVAFANGHAHTCLELLP